MTDRDRVIAAAVARAQQRGGRVYGFTTQYASCEELHPKKGGRDEWDYICAEGDGRWTPLPAREPEGGK